MEKLKMQLKELTETAINDLKTVKICSYKDMASVITAENLLDGYFNWFVLILPKITEADADDLLLILAKGQDDAFRYVRRRQELTR